MNILTALANLEMTPDEFRPPQQCPLQIINEYLNTFKDKIKKQRKILARKYHPDICKDENSLNKMKSINEAADFLEKLNIQQRQMMPRPVFKQTIIIRMGGMSMNMGGTNNSYTTSTTNGWETINFQW